jgi:branched-chain amino acid transport system permease protein
MRATTCLPRFLTRHRPRERRRLGVAPHAGGNEVKPGKWRMAMTTFLVYAILGLGAGVAYAMLAFGVVAIYKGSGVLNFAQGAIAMFAAYWFADLTGAGSGRGGMSVYAALAIVMAGSALFGVAFHFLVMKRLRSAPVLARVVVTLGLLSLLQGVVILRWGMAFTPNVPSLFPTGAVSIGGGAHVGASEFWALGLVIVVTAGLWWLYRYTRFGLATRAAAENEKGAALLGYSPDVIASLNWALGSALAALAGVIIAPVSGLDSGAMPLLILPACAAALLGRFRSFSVAALVALLIGVAQSELTNYWGSQPGVTVAVPLVVVILAMVVSGRLIPPRGTLSEGRPPKSPSGRIPVIPTVVAVVLGVALLLFGGTTYQTAMATTIAFAVLALSTVMITGYVGQISLAQMTFAGLAGFFLSKLAGDFGVPFPLGILVAAILAVPVGALIGLPALRVRGINLAVVTLALAYAVSEIVFGNQSWTGGFLPGTAAVPSPSIGGFSLDGLLYPERYGLFALVVLILVAIVVSNLRRSSTGRKLLAVRANERAAAAAGIDVSRLKLQAFALSSFVAALGGALLATAFDEATFTQFSSSASITLITIAYIGGIASVGGALFAGLSASGGVIYILLSHIPGFGNYYLPITGLLLMITVMANPDGVIPLMQENLQELRARIRARRTAPAPELVAK